MRLFHLTALALLALGCTAAVAGGPKYIAGASYFNAAVMGQPVHWAGGQVSYYVDQGPLNSAISNQQATAMVDAAAALWSAVPTAGVNLVDQGQLNEDVSGADVQANAQGRFAASAAGQSVAWQSAAGMAAPAGAVVTNAQGIAAQTLTVGPLAEGQQASVQACLNGTSQCVTFTAFGARPEYAVLEAVSGASQSLAASGTPAQIALRLLDMNSNPMAGGTVTLYQALYAWSPPCAEHAVCTQGALLSAESSTATSAIDGTVTFTPASLPGAATNLLGVAATGNTAAVSIAVEQHP